MLRLFPVFSPILFLLITFITGFITPGYSHLKHTISRLAIEKYGFIQQMNFFQFGIGMYLTGKLFASSLKLKNSRSYIRKFYNFCSILLVLAAIIPADPIENAKFSLSLLTPFGLVHILIVVLFVVLSPFCIKRIYEIFKSEKHYNRLSGFTIFMGISTLLMCIVWFLFFFREIYFDYRGLFQKIITLWSFCWIIVVNWNTLRYTANAK